MALVKARDIKEESGSIVFDFKDVAAEAQAMLDAANAEAKRIVDKAKAETQQKQEAVFAEAEKKGFEQGRKKGYEDAFEPSKKEGYGKGYSEALEKVKEQFEIHVNEPLEDLKAVLNYFDQNKKNLLWQAEQSFVLLAVKLAEKVIRKNIEFNPEMIKDTVAAALETVSQTTNVTVRVSPDDISVIEELKGDLEHVIGRFDSVKFYPDIDISRGGCLILTERGKVDAQIEVQLERIARDILDAKGEMKIGEEDLQQRIRQSIKVPDESRESNISEVASQEKVEDSIAADETQIKPDEDSTALDSLDSEETHPDLQVENENLQSGMIEEEIEKDQEGEPQNEPKIDQATELRKQMEDNNEKGTQE